MMLLRCRDDAQNRAGAEDSCDEHPEGIFIFSDQVGRWDDFVPGPTTAIRCNLIGPNQDPTRSRSQWRITLQNYLDESGTALAAVEEPYMPGLRKTFVVLSQEAVNDVKMLRTFV